MLKQSGTVLRAVASDGAEWYATPHGLTRVDPKSPRAIARNTFAGKRYLPDDDVQQLAADQAAGMWVRTRTGVSHIELRDHDAGRQSGALRRARARAA